MRLFGPLNENLARVERASGAKLSTKGTELIIEGPEDVRAPVLRLFGELYSMVKAGDTPQEADFTQGFTLAKDPEVDLSSLFKEGASIVTPRKTVRARNFAQRRLIEAMLQNEMVFSTGPAGTGKTYLAVAMALAMMAQKKVKRLILTRPAVEAGEKLGFLPGDLTEKVDPYLRPLFDALQDMLGPEQLQARQENGLIEVAPLAFMRGRTLENAFIILDEAQNTTREQMKMFLTRLGYGSRAVITGDITQIDLPPIHHSRLEASEKPGETRSGLVHALRVLQNVKGITFHTFDRGDVVRHPLVGRIVEAYENATTP